MTVRLDPRLRCYATDMRNAPTPPEAVLWSRLRASQLGFKFRRQTVIGTYIADFFCPAVGLIVELDGRTHDGDDDRRRDMVLAGKGFRVLRFTNAEVSADIDRVLNAIYVTARDLPPRFGPHPPAPSPEGEGEQAGLPTKGEGEQKGILSPSGEGRETRGARPGGGAGTERSL